MLRSEVWHLVLYIPPKEPCVPPKKTYTQLKEPYIQCTELMCHFRQRSPMSLVGHLWQTIYIYIYINIYIYMKKPYISSGFFGGSGTYVRNNTPPPIAEDSETCFYSSCSSEDRDTATAILRAKNRIFHGTSPVFRQKNILWRTERPAVALAARVRALKVHSALTLRLNVCDVTHSYVGLDTSKYGTWRIRMWDVTYSFVGRNSLICGAWRISESF